MLGGVLREWPPRALAFKVDFGVPSVEFVMNIDRAVLVLAGSIVLISAALAFIVSPYWLLLTAFVGVNLLQAAFTGFCPAATIFRKLGLKAGSAFACPAAKG